MPNATTQPEQASASATRANLLAAHAANPGTATRPILEVDWPSKPLLKALGIRVPHGDGFYILRHGNATLMSSFGAPQKLRQERLGHADGSPVTETIYTHVISEDGKRVAARLGSAVWGTLPESWTRFGRQLDVNGWKKENGSGVEPPKPLYLN